MKLNIKTKLIGGFLMVVGLLLVVAVVGWNGLSTLNAATDHIVHEQLPEDEQLRDLQFQVALQGELYFEYALTLDEEILEEARSHTEIIREEALLLEEELAGETEMLEQLRQFEMEYEEFHNELELVAADYAAGDTVAGVAAIHIAAAQEEQLEAELAELAHEVEQQMEASFTGAERSYRNAINMVLGVSVVAVVVALGLGWFLSRSISNGVRQVAQGASQLAEEVMPKLASVTQAVAAGDLTVKAEFQTQRVEVNSKDEIGALAEAFNSMVRAFSFSCLVGKAHHVESFAEMGIVAV